MTTPTPRYIVVSNERWNEITNESVQVSRPIAVDEAFENEDYYAYTVVIEGYDGTARIEHWDVDGTFDDCRREGAEESAHIAGLYSPQAVGR